MNHMNQKSVLIHFKELFESFESLKLIRMPIIWKNVINPKFELETIQICDQ